MNFYGHFLYSVTELEQARGAKPDLQVRLAIYPMLSLFAVFTWAWIHRDDDLATFWKP